MSEHEDQTKTERVVEETGVEDPLERREPRERPSERSDEPQTIPFVQTSP